MKHKSDIEEDKKDQLRNDKIEGKTLKHKTEVNNLTQKFNILIIDQNRTEAKCILVIQKPCNHQSLLFYQKYIQ